MLVLDLELDQVMATNNAARFQRAINSEAAAIRKEAEKSKKGGKPKRRKSAGKLKDTELLTPTGKDGKSVKATPKGAKASDTGAKSSGVKKSSDAKSKGDKQPREWHKLNETSKGSGTKKLPASKYGDYSSLTDVFKVLRKEDTLQGNQGERRRR
jgi:hypothetical protein